MVAGARVPSSSAHGLCAPALRRRRHHRRRHVDRALHSAADAPAQTIKVRLAEVDAPEHHQPFGTRSREHLAALCFKQSAEVRPVTANGGLDKYGRTVAHVSCKGIDANAEQVRAGMAWAYPRYVIDRVALSAAGRGPSCAPWAVG